ncbi:MAG TPA: hypothetical protein ENJ95_11625 [Bacteroidetes bacterium]|nr:hypothetical protein [Bacteroidota bacterium]
MKKIALPALLLILLFSCKHEPLTTGIPVVQNPVSTIKLKSIEYKIRNGYGDLNKDYITEYVYENNRIVGINNFLDRYDKRYTYTDGKVSERAYFDLNKNRVVAVDSFIYKPNGQLKEKKHYQTDENGLKIYRRKTKFYFGDNGKIKKSEDYRIPENELTFTHEYIWESGNIVRHKCYFEDGSSLSNIEEIFEYDQGQNHLALCIADIDEPQSKNNFSDMELSDFIGNYDGIFKIENEFEYNDDNLPEKIICSKRGVFDTFRDTLLIEYQ